MTDGIYAEVVWKIGNNARQFTARFGCNSAQANKIYDNIGDAEHLVEAWAANAPIVDETETSSPKSPG